MTRVLLVTGARTLATRPGAEAWARGKIAAALRGVDLLIVGDAPGPDAWASRIQRDALRRVECYRTHGLDVGWITVAHCEEWDRVRRWSPPRAIHSPRYPLMRNAAMVRDLAALQRDGAAVEGLALLDGLKVDKPARDGKPTERATRGTEHTVRLARAAGLTVREEVWRG